MTKRLFDISASVIGLIALAPILAVIVLCIRLADGRPVFFRQLRVGRFGLDFTMIKFRTMRVLKEAEQGRFDAGSRQRVTRLGRFLRRSKLDELPGLWNVLVGDMSLVGPRPEVRRWVEAYPQRWQKVLTVRPGITDPASILFRHEERLLSAADDPESYYRQVILPQKLSLYEEYIDERTCWGDVLILLKTVKAVGK